MCVCVLLSGGVPQLSTFGDSKGGDFGARKSGQVFFGFGPFLFAWRQPFCSGLVKHEMRGRRRKRVTLSTWNLTSSARTAF